MEQHDTYFFWEASSSPFSGAAGICSALGLSLAPVVTQDDYDKLTASTLSEYTVF